MRCGAALLGTALLGACAHSGGGPGEAPADAGLMASADAGADVGASADAAAHDAASTGDAAPVDASAEASAADGAAGVSAPLAVRATSGWQVYPGGSYHYGPSVLIDTDASIHMWTCSPGTGGAWDFVRYHHSTDGGHTWSADVVALQPTAGSVDAYSTCDPGAVKIGSYFYVGYTSTTNSAGTDNDVFIARSASPTGPFDKWNGAGWGGSPQPLVDYKGAATDYGYGEPSLVLMGNKLFVYYSDDEATQSTNVATVDDATVDAWPLHLVDHGHAIVRDRNAQDSADVKYVDALGRFIAVTTYERFTPNGTVAAYQSTDGLTFAPTPFLGARTQIGMHNIGLSGDLTGHLDLAAANFIAYAYQPVGNGWGNWPTFLDPVAVGTAPRGTAVAGEVSSIVGGNDWSWSGPLAWDGNPATVFSSASHGTTAIANEWAWIDTGASSSIDGVTVVPRAGGLGFPVDFSIQTSPDASTWTDVPGQTFTAYANPGSAPVTFAFASPVAARFARLNATRLGTDNAGNTYLQLGELAAIVGP